MALTRSQRQAALKYVIKTIFEYEDTDLLVKCLKENGIDDISDLIGMAYDHVETLVFRGDAGTEENLDKGRKEIIRCFRVFYSHKQATVTPIDDKWDQADPKEFHDYRLSPDYIAILSTTVPKVWLQQLVLIGRVMTLCLCPQRLSNMMHLHSQHSRIKINGMILIESLLLLPEHKN